MHADCVFANLGGGVATSVALVNVQASFLRCDFSDNVAAVPQATVLSAGGTAAVRLEQCLFRGNAGAGQLALDWTAKPPMSMSGYFSDEGMHGSLAVAPGGAGGGGPVCHCREGAEAAMTLVQAPTVFLTPSDKWLTSTQKVWACPARVPVEESALHFAPVCCVWGCGGRLCSFGMHGETHSEGFWLGFLAWGCGCGERRDVR